MTQKNVSGLSALAQLNNRIELKKNKGEKVSKEEEQEARDMLTAIVREQVGTLGLHERHLPVTCHCVLGYVTAGGHQGTTLHALLPSPSSPKRKLVEHALTEAARDMLITLVISKPKEYGVEPRLLGYELAGELLALADGIIGDLVQLAEAESAPAWGGRRGSSVAASAPKSPTVARAPAG